MRVGDRGGSLWSAADDLGGIHSSRSSLIGLLPCVIVILPSHQTALTAVSCLSIRSLGHLSTAEGAGAAPYSTTSIHVFQCVCLTGCRWRSRRWSGPGSASPLLPRPRDSDAAARPRLGRSPPTRTQCSCSRRSCVAAVIIEAGRTKFTEQASHCTFIIINVVIIATSTWTLATGSVAAGESKDTVATTLSGLLLLRQLYVLMKYKRVTLMKTATRQNHDINIFTRIRARTR